MPFTPNNGFKLRALEIETSSKTIDETFSYLYQLGAMINPIKKTAILCSNSVTLSHGQ